MILLYICIMIIMIYYYHFIYWILIIFMICGFGFDLDLFDEFFGWNFVRQYYFSNCFCYVDAEDAFYQLVVGLLAWGWSWLLNLFASIDRWLNLEHLY